MTSKRDNKPFKSVILKKISFVREPPDPEKPGADRVKYRRKSFKNSKTLRIERAMIFLIFK